MNRIEYLLILFFVSSLAIMACNKDNCDLSCQNGGILTIDCECACPDGYTGASCETLTCNLSCQNGGTITNNCTCDCPSGFEGEFCQTESCNIVCQNDGTVTSDCTCDCPSGYGGDNCENCVPRVFLPYAGNFYAPTTQPNYVNDLQVTLPDDYFLTGVGFDPYNTLVLTGREMLNDGQFGEPNEFRDGPNPSGTPTVSFVVPDGYVITGVGYGASSGGYRLVVNYNEILVTPNCNVYLGAEELYDNMANQGVQVWLKISELNIGFGDFVFGGLGLKFGSNRQVETEVRDIYNFP